MVKVNLSKYKGIKTGKNVNISADKFEAMGTATIGDNVTIEAERVILGDGCKIENDVVVKSLKQASERFALGDESLLGHNTQIMVPDFWMGDYSQIYNNNLISGYQPITVGHNCWVGQHTILNCYEKLSIGNNCRIGPHVQMWTHVASGELLEGCNFYGSGPVTLEDNVWFQGGGATIIPGLTLARNTILMVGAVLTKSTEPYKIYAGVPAKDVTEKLNPWKEMKLEEKYTMLSGFVNDFAKEYPEFKSGLFYAKSTKDASVAQAILKEDALLFMKEVKDWEYFKDAACTVFDLNSKKYRKKRTEIEKRWSWFTVGHRARFTPLEEVGV